MKGALRFRWSVRSTAGHSERAAAQFEKTQKWINFTDSWLMMFTFFRVRMEQKPYQLLFYWCFRWFWSGCLKSQTPYVSFHKNFATGFLPHKPNTLRLQAELAGHAWPIFRLGGTNIDRDVWDNLGSQFKTILQRNNFRDYREILVQDTLSQASLRDNREQVVAGTLGWTQEDRVLVQQD
jgi:hypothetical protein